jgi:urea transport system permease protein
MSPTLVGIVPSIEMVILAAVGGRLSLLGAVYGAVLVNLGKTYFSEAFPELWLFLLGGLFIVVVMFFPNGLAGLYEKYVRPLFFKNKNKAPAAPPSDSSSGSDTPISPVVNEETSK